MTLTPQQSPHPKSVRAFDEQRLPLSNLKPPKPGGVVKTSSETAKREAPKTSEAHPAHFAPENPINRELAKERWYTRAAWACMGIGYSAALFSIKYGEGEYSPRTLVTGILIDTLFSYWALRNSELRKCILEGAVLPNPNHSDTTVIRLFGVGMLCQFLGSLSNAAYMVSLISQAEYTGAIIRGAVALNTLHLGFAWLRRLRFFSSIDSQ